MSTSMMETTLPAKQPLLQRIWKNPALEHYVRLVILVSSINLGWLVYGMTEGGWFSAGNLNLQA